MTIANLRVKMEQLRAEVERFEAAFTALLDAKRGFKATKDITDCRGRALTKWIMVTRSTDPGVAWRLTYGDDDGPSGHCNFHRLEELARETRGFLRNGYTPAPPYVLATEN